MKNQTVILNIMGLLAFVQGAFGLLAGKRRATFKQEDAVLPLLLDQGPIPSPDAL
jgi:hypothetical protein